MKFIKEMISRKNRVVEIEEEIEEPQEEPPAEEVVQEETSNAELYSDLAAIQSRLNEIDDVKSDKVEAVENKTDAAPAVVDFVDLVTDIGEPKGAPFQSAPKDAPDDTPVVVKKPTSVAKETEQPPLREARRRVEPENSEQFNKAVAKSGSPEPIARPETTAPKPAKPSAFAKGNPADRVVTTPPNGNKVNPDPSRERAAKPKMPHVSGVKTAPATQVEVADARNTAKPAPKIEPVVDVTKQTERDKPNIVEVPAPAAGRSGRRAGRVKTRLLGFSPNESAADPFDRSAQKSDPNESRCLTGWLVITEGPGRGASFTLFNGVSQIGRGDDQAIKLGFGDSSISRSNHAAIAYDDQDQKFYLGHGGKANLVRLNNRPVLSTEEIESNDLIKIGETTLRFVGFCGSDFSWDEDNLEDLNDAAIA